MTQHPGSEPPRWTGGRPDYAHPPQGPAWPPPPPPPPPRSPHGTALVVGISAVVLLLLGGLAVTAFVAPGFLVDDSDSSSADSDTDTGRGGNGDDPGGLPEVDIPPPNSSDLDTDPGDVPPPISEGDDPGQGPEQGSGGTPEEFATGYLSAVAAGDPAAVDGLMCAADQAWQYEDAVAEKRQLTLANAGPDASAPDGILADLYESDGTPEGRITVVPNGAGGWCVESFYVF